MWETYLGDGWLQLAAVTLRRVYDSAWQAGKVSAVRACVWRWWCVFVRIIEVYQQFTHFWPLLLKLSRCIFWEMCRLWAVVLSFQRRPRVPTDYEEVT